MPTSADSNADPSAAVATPSVASVAQLGVLLSRLDYPVTVTYGERQIRLSPNGRTETLNRALLPEALPAGVTFVRSTL